MSELDLDLDLDLNPPKKEIIKTWHAIAGGAAAATTPDAIKLWKRHEKLSIPIDSRNILEAAWHANTDKDMARVISGFKYGDPDSNIWNPELVNRLAAFTPQVLTVDSLRQENNKDTIWMYTPGRPKKINPLGFYTVSGDMHYHIYEDLAKGMASRTGKQYNEFYKGFMARLNEYEKNNPAYPKHIDNQKTLIMAEYISSALLGIAYVFSEPSIELDSSPLSRRVFLKGLAAGTAMLATAGTITTGKTFAKERGPVEAAFSKSEQRKEAWQSVISYVDEMPVDAWRDGRTAMLIAKHIDAMNYLRKQGYIQESAKGAIVMGAGHAFKADLHMHDKTSRDKAILAYTQLFIYIVDKFISDYYKIPTEQRRQLTGNLLDYFSTIEINHISDPGIPPEVKLSDYIETNIRPVATFKSQQVENAIKTIRP